MEIIGNIIVKLILKADARLKSKLINSLKKTSLTENYSNFRSKYAIDDSFRFNGIDILFYGNGEIFCGKNSYIGNYSTIQAYDGNKVVIGNNCSISHNVRIYTSSNITDQDMNNNLLKIKKVGDVIIGDGVWIGANVFIKENIEIKNNVIVGANSVVITDLEENGIYGGVPAKLIRFKKL